MCEMVYLYSSNFKQLIMWFNVLSYFDNQGYFQIGLTLPFLIGASSIIKPENSVLSIKEILLEVKDYGLNSRITLMHCGYLGEYVFGIFDNESESLYKDYKKPIYKQFENLIITDNSFDLYDDYSQIIESFENDYSSIIESGNFSKNNGIWDVYSDLDLSRLNEILD